MNTSRETRSALPHRGFTLVELLVTISIIVVLAALFGGAISAARNSSTGQRTRATIQAIDEIVRRHYDTCESRRLPVTATAAQRGADIRRQYTADVPDTWADVKALDGSTEFTLPRHRGYVATFKAVNPTVANEDAECLFMALMQGGIADCVTCTSLSMARKGDKDSDGAQEFWDEWGEPIRYVAWPAAFELPPGSGTRFFSTTPPFEGAPGGGRVMQPLIFSAGPDKLGSTAMTSGTNLAMGSNCGNPNVNPVNTYGGFATGDPKDCRADNLTNFDDEVAK